MTDDSDMEWEHYKDSNDFSEFSEEDFNKFFLSGMREAKILQEKYDIATSKDEKQEIFDDIDDILIQIVMAAGGELPPEVVEFLDIKPREVRRLNKLQAKQRLETGNMEKYAVIVNYISNHNNSLSHVEKIQEGYFEVDNFMKKFRYKGSEVSLDETLNDEHLRLRSYIMGRLEEREAAIRKSMKNGDKPDTEYKTKVPYFSRGIAVAALALAGVTSFIAWDNDQKLEDISQGVVARSEYDSQGKELEDAQGKLESALASGTASDEEISRLQAELKKLQNKNKTLVSENNTLGNEKGDLESLLSAANNARTEAENELASVSAEYAQYQLDQKGIMEGIQSEIGGYKRKITKLGAENTEQKRLYGLELIRLGEELKGIESAYATNLGIKQSEIDRLNDLLKPTIISESQPPAGKDEVYIPVTVHVRGEGIDYTQAGTVVKKWFHQRRMRGGGKFKDPLGLTYKEMTYLKSVNPEGKAFKYRIYLNNELITPEIHKELNQTKK